MVVKGVFGFFSKNSAPCLPTPYDRDVTVGNKNCNEWHSKMSNVTPKSEVLENVRINTAFDGVSLLPHMSIIFK